MADRKRASQTHGYQRLLLLLFGVTLALGQAAPHVVWQPFVAVLTHRLQIHLHKLISDRVRKEAKWEAGNRKRRKIQKEKETDEVGGGRGGRRERKRNKEIQQRGKNRVAETGAD